MLKLACIIFLAVSLSLSDSDCVSLSPQVQRYRAWISPFISVARDTGTFLRAWKEPIPTLEPAATQTALDGSRELAKEPGNSAGVENGIE